MKNNIAKDIVGFTAAFCLVITLLPQLYYTWKTKKADDISYGFLFLQLTTCLLFLIYGILIFEIPLITANSLVISQSFALTIMKIIFEKKNKNEKKEENNN